MYVVDKSRIPHKRRLHWVGATVHTAQAQTVHTQWVQQRLCSSACAVWVVRTGAGAVDTGLGAY